MEALEEFPVENLENFHDVSAYIDLNFYIKAQFDCKTTDGTSLTERINWSEVDQTKERFGVIVDSERCISTTFELHFRKENQSLQPNFLDAKVSGFKIQNFWS